MIVLNDDGLVLPEDRRAPGEFSALVFKPNFDNSLREARMQGTNEFFVDLACKRIPVLRRRRSLVLSFLLRFTFGFFESEGCGTACEWLAGPGRMQPEADFVGAWLNPQGLMLPIDEDLPVRPDACAAAILEFMRGDHQVKVLGIDRLRSELPMFVWSQSVAIQDKQKFFGKEPFDRTDFGECKSVLIAEVLKLAGLTLTLDALIARLTPIIALGTNEQIHLLDPILMAGKISGKPV